MRRLYRMLDVCGSLSKRCLQTAIVFLIIAAVATTSLVIPSVAQESGHDSSVTMVDNSTGQAAAPEAPPAEHDGRKPIIIAGIDLSQLDLERVLKFDGEYLAQLLEQVDLSQFTYEQVMAAVKTSLKTLLILVVSVGGIAISILGFVLIQVLKAFLLVGVNFMAQRMSVQNRRTLPLAGMKGAPTVKNFDEFALERAERGTAYRELLTDIKRRIGHLKEQLGTELWAQVAGLYKTSPRFDQTRRDLTEMVALRDRVRNEISTMIYERKVRLGIVDRNMVLMRAAANDQGGLKVLWQGLVQSFNQLRFRGFKLWLMPRFTTIGGGRDIRRRLKQFEMLEVECVRLYNILTEELSSFGDTLKVKLDINMSLDLPQPVYVVSGEQLVGAKVKDPFVDSDELTPVEQTEGQA